MENIVITNADILTSKEEVIVHQVNTTSIYAKGLAKSIFSKYPYADIYSNRTHVAFRGTHKLGDIVIKGDNNSSDTRIVVALVSQKYPGRPNTSNDTREIRLSAYKSCLDKLFKQGYKSIAFPYKIGCGLAGGDWDTYYKIIKIYALLYSDIKVVIYKL